MEIAQGQNRFMRTLISGANRSKSKVVGCLAQVRRAEVCAGGQEAGFIVRRDGEKGAYFHDPVACLQNITDQS
ncbi:MAG: hypothetical protein KGN84_10245 [Acidobacteriota bacterium]|nr:hypothetical protein [Acidobacteriota bacterium]